MSKKLKVLGLALIVICAFGALSASAQAAPKWTVSGVASGTEPITETATVTSSKLTLTVGKFFWVTCSTLKISGGTITVGTDIGSAASLAFGGCSVDDTKGHPLPECTTIKNVGGTNGTIKTKAVDSTLTNSGGVGFVEFAPASGSTLAELEVGPAPCLVAGTYNFVATISAKLLSPSSGVLQTNQELETNGGCDGKVDLHLVSDRNWGYDLV
jgi:hypothetical protein